MEITAEQCSCAKYAVISAVALLAACGVSDPPADDNQTPGHSHARAGELADELANPPSSASWRYGGGAGYPDRIDPDGPATQVVYNLVELEAALATAIPGDTVYIDDDARIDLTATTLCVPGGVRLASGRGHQGSAGALLYVTEIAKDPRIRACGDDVRITGLRLHGADPGICPPQYPSSCVADNGSNCRDCWITSQGIAISKYARLEVDNNELAGWSYAAVWLGDSADNHVHHNHIHHNQREGLGYGVVLTSKSAEGSTNVLVEWNRFDYNRHAVAGSGWPDQSYVARNNLVLEHANGHVFDMHGLHESLKNGSEVAGREVLVYQNTVLPVNKYALVVRGRPELQARIFDNCLYRARNYAAHQYCPITGEYCSIGNFFIDEAPDGSPAPNRYQQTAASCETPRWCQHPNGTGPLHYLAASTGELANLGFGDFDGNGKSDVFTTSAGKWWVADDGVGQWRVLNYSSTSLQSLRVGDFDGDGRDDLFTATGTTWRFSSGGNRPWTVLQSNTEALASLAFGDFDGDGITDVFRATGSEWQWSRSATDPWARLNVSGATLDNLGFGDFDGDGRTDVFSTAAGTWRWSAGGQRPWAVLRPSSVPLDSLRLADFDGNGRTDVFYVDANNWWVAYGGSNPPESTAVASATLSQLGLADFDGDGGADVFMTGCL